MNADHSIRVLMDCHAFAMQAYGGVSRIFIEIAKKLSSNNVELTLFGGVHINFYFEELQRAMKQAVGIRIPQLLGKQRILMPINRVLLKRYAATMTPDLVHFTYFSRTLPRRSGVREIMTVHDMTFELFPELFPANNPMVMLKKKMAQEVDGVICISENTKKDLLRFCDVPEERVRVIPHGNPMAGIISEKPANESVPFILFVGQRDLYKDFNVLLDALAGSIACMEWQVIAFGGGDFTAKERIEINRRGLQGRVLHESGSDGRLAGFYETAQVLVYPSRYEGFGLPPLEAMSRGCPVIVSDCSSLPEVVGNAGLYFKPNDAEELRCRIESIGDPQERRRLINHGYEQARNFSWGKCAEETARFYRDILEMPPR